MSEMYKIPDLTAEEMATLNAALICYMQAQKNLTGPWSDACNLKDKINFIEEETGFNVFIGDDVRYTSLGCPKIGRILDYLDDTLLVFIVETSSYVLLKKKDITAVFPRFQAQPKKS